MAKVVLPDGREWKVYATRDLDENWAVSLLSGDVVKGYPNLREFAPVVVKIRAKSKWFAVEYALKSLVEAGTIKSFENDPRPAEAAPAAAAAAGPAETEAE